VIASSHGALLGLVASAVLVCAVVTLWRRRLSSIVKALAVQGIALGLVAVLLGIDQHDLVLIAVGVVVVAVKGGVIPALLQRILTADVSNREVAPLINVPASLVGAALLTFLAFATTHSVVRLVGTRAGGFIPLGFATLLIGFFAMTIRRKAVSQIVGLLIVDNGIALIAFLATAGVPLLVELGASLDVLLIVVVLRVLTVQMNSTFGNLDLDQLRELHD
jgi:hydrogenase-4 component E